MLMLGYFAVPANAALDANCPGPTTGGAVAGVRNAQTFTAQATGTLVQGQLEIRKDAVGGDFVMTLYTADGSGTPTNDALGSTVIADASVPMGVSTVTGVFSPPPSVVAGQGYALALSRSPHGGYAMRERNDSACPGTEFISASLSGAWSNNGGTQYDYMFATFVDPPPPPVDSSAPSAAIGNGPKAKTKKKDATFTFTGSDRAVSGFQCSLDSGPFTACTSPHTVRVKKGRHTFQVRAIDQAGNVGAPATYEWKVKKKK